jgi:hypothetical protein
LDDFKRAPLGGQLGVAPKTSTARSETMRKVLIGLAVGLVMGGILVALVMPRHCPVNQAACNRIKKGMTRAEVEKILGGPAGNYRTQPGELFDLTNSGSLDDLEWESWIGDDGWVHVGFTVSGTVQEAWFSEAPPYDFSLVELMGWRLERLKERWFD